jgi:fibronectin-binding autotransporter adhesin
MTKSKLLQFVAAGSIGIPSMLFLLMSSASAASNCTWTGAGTTSNFSDSGNWSNCNTGGGGVPLAGDSLVFPETATNLSPVNDMTAGTSFGSISFIGTPAGNTAYAITGNAIALTAGIDDTSGASVSTPNSIELGITVSGNQEFASTNYSLQIGTQASPFTTLAVGSSTLQLTNVVNFSDITGSGAIDVTGGGTTSLSVASGTTSAFTGAYTVDAGSLLEVMSSEFTNAASLTVASSGEVYFLDQSAFTLATPLNVAGDGNQGTGGAINASNNMTITGPVVLQADTEFFPAAGTTMTLTGPLSGAYTLGTSAGAGTLVISASTNTSNTPNGTIAPSASASSSGSGNTTTTAAAAAAPGTPDTGLAATKANPIVILILSVIAAGTLFMIARTLRPVPVKQSVRSSRRK